MSSFTTEDERPDEWSRERQEKDPTGGTIGQTRGVWIRKMNNGDHEVYYDGKFIVSYGGWNEHIAANAMEQLYDYAFKEGEKHNQQTLKKALGL